MRWTYTTYGMGYKLILLVTAQRESLRRVKGIRQSAHLQFRYPTVETMQANSSPRETIISNPRIVVCFVFDRLFNWKSRFLGWSSRRIKTFCVVDQKGVLVDTPLLVRLYDPSTR
jgi:hypothetical protein